MMTESISIEKAIREYSNAELLQYLQDIENEENYKKVMQECMFRWSRGFSVLLPQSRCTSLMLALDLGKSVEVILKLIDIGGKELVMRMIAVSEQHYILHVRLKICHYILSRHS